MSRKNCNVYFDEDSTRQSSSSEKRKRTKIWNPDGDFSETKRYKVLYEEETDEMPPNWGAAGDSFYISREEPTLFRSYAELPQELILKIFSYLPQNDLITTSSVCSVWRDVAFDRSLWKHFKNLNIQGRLLGTRDAKTLIEISEELEHLEISCRNDIAELLQFAPEKKPNLKSLQLKNCVCQSDSQDEIRCALTDIIDKAPQLKILTIEYVPLRSKAFYKILALNFSKLDKVMITSTNMEEMITFVQVLQHYVPNLRFHEGGFIGRGEGKRIYWGPVVGLSIRPIAYVSYEAIPHVRQNYMNYG